MDFKELLSVAQQNTSESSSSKNFYRTKFDPPKKTVKEKKLSASIKRFLEKRELEEQEKLRKAHEKKLELLARRDPKEQRKIEKTLKVIKSSKKFYTGDKTLDENTEITLTNDSSLPDEDDYGFESKTSEEFHRNFMQKYKQIDSKTIGCSQKKKLNKNSIMDIGSNTDDPHFKNGQRKRVSGMKNDVDSATSASAKDSSSKPGNKNEKPKPKPRPPPPAMNFEQLLKIAEQKQHEDIVIDVPVKKEAERLLTSKEKKELEEIEAARKARMKGYMNNKIPKLSASKTSDHDKNNNNKSAIPKSSDNNKRQNSEIKLEAQRTMKTLDSNKPTTNVSGTGSKLRDALIKADRPISPSCSKNVSQKLPLKAKSKALAGPSASSNAKSSKNSSIAKSSSSPPVRPAEKPRLLKEAVKTTREFPPKDLKKSRDFPPKDLLRTREFPPRDLKRHLQPQSASKRRIYDDDDEDSEEYDSELDDFIDDGDVDFNYSNEIRNIFGYDKSRYRDEDFDDRQMESDFRTVMKEESYSKKMGRLEDLEDMMMEAREKEEKERRKKEMMKKKKRKHE